MFMQKQQLADVIRTYVADAVRHAKRRYGLTWINSEASLEQIDRMLDARMRGKVIEPDKLKSETGCRK